jgi:hypothetical protein
MPPRPHDEEKRKERYVSLKLRSLSRSMPCAWLEASLPLRISLPRVKVTNNRDAKLRPFMSETRIHVK